MKQLQTLVFFLFNLTIAFSQNLKLPKKPYVLLVDKYKFVSKTIIEKDPLFLDGNLASANFNGVVIETSSNDTTKEDANFIEGDSLRLWTYLYK